ncbi:hypothetical protein B4135_3322 [Caldibacillus debilis]|uniref:Uncharacterized protein n=1 Tax=Caldibacillus debilis TaxID=301148 RepID=A0A150LFV2_9BACI|nr:hypothetical protein B4135_3322 [Caldibacillus debilis]
MHWKGCVSGRFLSIFSTYCNKGAYRRPSRTKKRETGKRPAEGKNLPSPDFFPQKCRDFPDSPTRGVISRQHPVNVQHPRKGAGVGRNFGNGRGPSAAWAGRRSSRNGTLSPLDSSSPIRQNSISVNTS